MGGEMVAPIRNLPEDQRHDWSAEETVSRQRDGSTLWQVEAECNKHWILVWGSTRSQAWQAATRMADRIRRGQ